MLRALSFAALLALLACERSTPKPPAETQPAAATATVAATNTLDPVCEMEVDPKTSISTTHEGKTYYFCSESCRQQFKADPAKFLAE